jgi:hypothetical protein
MLVAAFALALISCGTALGIANAFAQKTWLQGWDASSSYDTPGARYLDMNMAFKSCRCYARVAFIDTTGNWHKSYTDTAETTTTREWDNPYYTKKGYCKNNSSSVYTATCIVEW